MHSPDVSKSMPRGRPPIADAGEIALVAVRLFAARGYDAVSMSELAEAAGLSRRALFNYFPTKAALVWVGFEPFTAAMSAEIASADTDQSVLDAVESALLSAFAALDATPSTVRTRLQIIHNHPELLVHGASGISATRRIIRGYVESRLDLPPQSLHGVAIAEALTSVSFTAFQHWAVFSSEDSPAGVLHEMFGALRSGLAGPRIP
jgi:AcrR family transcriptional regulator